MEDLLERRPHCHVPEVPNHCVVRFEEVIPQPLRETQWSALVANSKEKSITPYREVNVFCMIFSSSITSTSNTKKRSTGCHHGIWSAMERQCKSAGRAYVVGPRWSVEHEFSVEYCVPHWELLVGVMREEKPCLEVVLVLTVYLRIGTRLL